MPDRTRPKQGRRQAGFSLVKSCIYISRIQPGARSRTSVCGRGPVQRPRTGAAVTQAETTNASAVGLPRTGDFDGAALASGRAIDPAQWVSDDPILGLVREAG